MKFFISFSSTKLKKLRKTATEKQRCIDAQTAVIDALQKELDEYKHLGKGWVIVNCHEKDKMWITLRNGVFALSRAPFEAMRFSRKEDAYTFLKSFNSHFTFFTYMFVERYPE